MARSTSTKKAAKLAQKGSGRSIRFQGGTVFPIAVAVTLTVGVALIAYGRATLPSADSTEPTIDQHWHAAYGFNICGEWYRLSGNLEDRDNRGNYIYTNFLRSGIHSHDDGIIHWHPSTSRAVGRNAVLGVFLESYDVELTDDSLTFPAQNVLGFADEYVEGETQCDGEDAALSVRAWGSFTDTDAGDRYIANMDRVHIDNDGMVFGIYFGPDDMDQSMPPWAQDLPTLGALDSGQPLPQEILGSESSVVVDQTVAPTEGGSVPATDDVTDSTEPATTDPATTEPATTEPATTDSGG